MSYIHILINYIIYVLSTSIQAFNIYHLLVETLRGKRFSNNIYLSNIFFKASSFFVEPLKLRQRRILSPSHEGPKCIVFPSQQEGVIEINEKSLIFEPGAPACARGAPSTTHPLPHFRKGALSPAENAAAKKRGPSGTHGSLCLFEHGRPHKASRR